MSDHKTNQAMLPPDPGGLNRALGRAAAEHLREVAPHLAPCPSCQAGICAEHGPTVTATTTGAHARDCGGTYRGCAPDCFKPSPSPAPEAAGEMSREEYRRMLSVLVNEAHERGAGCKSVAVESTCGELVGHDAALRASREAERKNRNRAEIALQLTQSERDEAREQRDDLANEILAGRSDLAAANARAVKAEKERDEAGRLLGVVVCAGTLAPDERLKDAPAHAAVSAIIGMAEQRDMYVRLYAGQLAKIEVESVEAVGRLAAAEAEVKRLRGDLAAERRLTLSYDDPSLDGTDGAHPAWWRGSDAGVAGAVRIVNEALDGPLPLAGCVGGADLEAVRQRVAALRSSVARLVEAGDEARDILNAILDNQYTYRERVDAVDRWVARWAAAKAGRALDAPAGSEARK